METLQSAFQWGAKQLKKHRCPNTNPVPEAEGLLLAACGIERALLLTRPETSINKTKADKYRQLILRRTRHEPLAHLLGSAFFFGREFAVSRAVLIPRPATEIIVESALATAKWMPDAAVLDIGTGSGAVAVTLASEMPARKILATDSSSAALTVARVNARRLGASSRISFMRGDLAGPALKFLEKRGGGKAGKQESSAGGRKSFPTFPLSRFPASPYRSLLVIANLPYIPTADWRKLPPDIKRFEPRSALDGGIDGLDLYRRLLRQLSATKAPTTIIVEILPKQRRTLESFCRDMLKGCRIEVIKNLAGMTVGLALKI